MSVVSLFVIVVCSSNLLTDDFQSNNKDAVDFISSFVIDDDDIYSSISTLQMLSNTSVKQREVLGYKITKSKIDSCLADLFILQKEGVLEDSSHGEDCIEPNM